jgi:hypothetical protein
MKLIIVALLLLVSSATAANAYIEAGSMIILMQILAAASAGFILMFRRVRTYLAGIRNKLLGKSDSGKSDPQDSQRDRES